MRHLASILERVLYVIANVLAITSVPFIISVWMHKSFDDYGIRKDWWDAR